MLSKTEVQSLLTFGLDHLPRERLIVNRHIANGSARSLAPNLGALTRSRWDASASELLAAKVLDLAYSHPFLAEDAYRQTHQEFYTEDEHGIITASFNHDLEKDSLSFGIDDAIGTAQTNRATIEAELDATVRELARVSGSPLPPWMLNQKNKQNNDAFVLTADERRAAWDLRARRIDADAETSDSQRRADGDTVNKPAKESESVKLNNEREAALDAIAQDLAHDSVASERQPTAPAAKPTSGITKSEAVIAFDEITNGKIRDALGRRREWIAGAVLTIGRRGHKDEAKWHPVELAKAINEHYGKDDHSFSLKLIRIFDNYAFLKSYKAEVCDLFDRFGD